MTKHVNSNMIYFPSGKIWTVGELSEATSAYRNRDMGLNACAKAYGVPNATLKSKNKQKAIYAQMK